MSKFDTKEFKDLQKEWYTTLKKEGFKDIELSQKEAGFRLERIDGRGKYGQYSKEWQQSKAEYYYVVNHFLNNHKFATELDKVIWEYHANGLSARSISKILNNTKIMKTNRTTVWIKIRDLRKIMRGLAISE